MRKWLMEYRTAVILAALSILGVAFMIVSDTMRASALSFDDPLITSDRKDLAICVEAADASAKGELTSAVRAAAAELKSDEVFQRAYARHLNIRVAAGCPGPGYILQPGVMNHPGTGLVGRTNRVTKASPFRVHIYLVSPEEVQTAFILVEKRHTGQEWICDGDMCNQVTTALYLTAGELGETSALKERLAQSLGIRPSVRTNSPGGKLGD